MSDIFISYASEDRSRIKPLVSALEKRGWTVWWDPAILAGMVWEREIEAALEGSLCVIVAWSEASVRSEWVRTEAREGMRRGILVPVLLDRVAIPLAFRSYQAANLVGWAGELPDSQFEELAKAVAAVLGSGAPLAAAPFTRVAGDVKVNPRDNLYYVWIPPGKFRMGCSSGDSECDIDEKPAHDVLITSGLWMSQTEVTQAAYEAVTGKNPSRFKGADLPVDSVTWDEAMSYCEAVGMRLPTEAEWEYAARAGSAASRYGSLADIAWYVGNSEQKSRPVALKAPNKWGLYDTLGNVWEWVGDWYDPAYYRQSPSSDPPGPRALGESGRVVRGGSANNYPRYLRVSIRLGHRVAKRNADIGFRCGGQLP